MLGANMILEQVTPYRYGGRARLRALIGKARERILNRSRHLNAFLDHS